MKATDEQVHAWAGRHCIVGTITAQREAFEDAQTLVQKPLQQPLTDFDARGLLAKLKCWHRLTEPECDELVKLFIDHIPDATKMVKPLTDVQIARCWHDTPWNENLKTRVFPFARAIEAAIKGGS